MRSVPGILDAIPVRDASLEVAAELQTEESLLAPFQGFHVGQITELVLWNCLLPACNPQIYIISCNLHNIFYPGESEITNLSFVPIHQVGPTPPLGGSNLTDRTPPIYLIKKVPRPPSLKDASGGFCLKAF
jgi:hypothetical protein